MENAKMFENFYSCFEEDFLTHNRHCHQDGAFAIGRVFRSTNDEDMGTASSNGRVRLHRRFMVHFFL
jgi:hypothetical protein